MRESNASAPLVMVALTRVAYGLLAGQPRRFQRSLAPLLKHGFPGDDLLLGFSGLFQRGRRNAAAFQPASLTGPRVSSATFKVAAPMDVGLLDSSR